MALPLLSACHGDDIDDGLDGSVSLNAMPRISLNIMPVSLGPVNADVTEMIGTLRVIILSETTEDITDEETGEVTEAKTCFVEYNQYFDFTGAQEDGMFNGLGQTANNFSFIITRNTVPGIKKFYLIANENKVTPIQFQYDGKLPAGVTNDMDLHKFLDLYKADFIPNMSYGGTETVPEKGDPKGAEFEQLVNAIYYTPQFTQESQNLSGGAERSVIFLPYTSYYEFSLATQADINSGKVNGAVNILDGNIYLVPCATKFRFQFQNYREQAVTINSFTLSGMAKDIYLFAQVYGDDLNKKKFGALSNLWWIDWLAMVSAASESHVDPDDNLAFNSSYGWMNLYNIPTTAIDYEPENTDQDNAMEKGVVELITGNAWNIDGRAPDSNPVTGTPGTLETGYFYLPESRYMVKFPVYNENGDQVGDQMRQAYYLTLNMKGGEEGGEPTEKSTQIANLGSMFRNTKAYITIRLRDAGDVGAYAELQPWDESHTNGTVIEEPSNE